jgi:hypothetical protein
MKHQKKGRSKFEDTLIKRLKGCEYEPYRLTYTSERTYLVDFVPVCDESILIEAKGRFRSSEEARKYVDIQKSHPDKEIVFIFMAPKQPMPHAKRRKDGTKMSHGEWADKNGFKYYELSSLPLEWRKK